MTAVALILTALFLLQILELRGRLRAIPVLPPAEGPLRPEHRLLVAQGVELPDAVKSAASAYAAAHDLQVLDLIPGDISAASALTLAMIYDPAACRARPLQRGASLGHAILVHVGLARRFEEGEPLPEHPTRLELARIGLRLRPYAPRQSEVAVAPGLRALPEPARARRALMELYNPLGLAKFALLLRLLLYAFMVAAALTTPWAGWALLGAFQLQPLGTLAGLPFGTRGLLPLTLLRLPLELIDWAALVLHAPPRQSTDALRPAYAELMARGIEPFFEAETIGDDEIGGRHRGNLAR